MSLPREEKYVWTNHARMKMRHYRLTESRIIRVLRYPTRLEEGIMDGAVACMQPAGGKTYSEIWAMYLVGGKRKTIDKKQLKIITAWRYPGKSPERDPIPSEVLREIKNLIFASV
ncbi:MAG: hypothetical protein A3J58_01900 [Candidatus Sungbacteria bacterium RIFCSPHIGHO2_02_FULL_52_23]|uniref:Uncharacterized protein n=1 Tax=Candidatus Sungbacteria bacterium RIFCSPHIGHO2_02_FULL_52_23 TaxID=1802274 RepID=A0A1G2KSE6_9BACT|nr:MAG: hypothetical protein A3J58_01900 [Candidatus Sungbacteria bacterium RIFCSPHIGHO2_02_FULL_52_23]